MHVEQCFTLNVYEENVNFTKIAQKKDAAQKPHELNVVAKQNQFRLTDWTKKRQTLRGTVYSDPHSCS